MAVYLEKPELREMARRIEAETDADERLYWDSTAIPLTDEERETIKALAGERCTLYDSVHGRFHDDRPRGCW